MAIPLYPYQVVGARWLASGPRVRLLADDMGIGKSAQAVAGCDLVAAKHVTVICPAVMKHQWRREFLRFGKIHRQITVLGETHRERLPETGVVVCSFEYASSVNGQMMLSLRRNDVVVVDEAHYCKERMSNRTRAIFGDHCDGRGGIVEKARYIFLLTGTPAPNNAGELYPFLRLAGVWNAGYWPFLNHFCDYRVGRHDSIVVHKTKNKTELREMLSQIMLRRLRDQVLTDMPELTISDRLIEPTEVNPARPILEDLWRNEPRAARMIEAAMASDDWSLADAKYVATVRRMIGLAKVRSLVAYVKGELKSNPGEKFLVFAIHRDVLKYMQAFFGTHTHILYGGTPEHKRERFIQSFQANPRQRVILCQIKTAGTGLTLTAANRVLIAEPSWVPADNLQAIMRAYRIGQRRPVLAEFASLLGSIDERVNASLKNKAIDIASILD